MSSTYTPTIGLEIHAELKTQTKMFCNSKNDPDETDPNVNICPVCMGFPGTLPVVNKEAVRHVLRVGASLGGTIADYTEFDRKNYFYPDLPKGYQISQYQFPLVSKGSLRGVAITRVHLEEDTARSQHTSTSLSTGTSTSLSASGGDEWSLVDFNRSGIPLMELVTEPVIHDAQTASQCAQELQLLLRSLGAGDANMEKGQMRVEANISVSKTAKLGTKVEVKNLNSFKTVEKAIAYEIKRQAEALERGETIVQETRGWDENKQSTFSQRIKEDSHDYRYFPDPDIPKFRLTRIDEFSLKNITDSLPEFPWIKRERFMKSGLDATSAEILVADSQYASLYDEKIDPIKNTEERKIAAHILLTSIRGMNASDSELNNIGDSLGIAARMRVSGEISSSAAAVVIQEVLKSGRPFTSIAREKGLLQMSDSAGIEHIAIEIVKENGEVVKEIKAGKEEAMKYLLGQGMKKTKGAVNPSQLEVVLKRIILP